MSPSQVQHRRPRVLLLAYACRPDEGSESAVGWNRAIETAGYCDTWVLCEGNWARAAVRGHLETRGAIPGLNFEFIAKRPLERLLTRVPGFYYVAYNLWHRRAYRVAKKLHEQVRFDLVHQLNLVGYREPGYLWKLDIPFVWGPFGGTQNLPWRFLAELGPLGAAAELARTLTNLLQLRFSPRVRQAARKAVALLLANSTIQRDFGRAHRLLSMVQLETGLPSIGAARTPGHTDRTTLHILWSGGFRPFKALPLLLKALAQLPAETAFELRVVGDGPQKRRWQRTARRLGLARRISWQGWLSHQEALRQYEWADVFVFTSLRDTSGNAVLEALGAGVPVICLDHQGMRDIVTPRCGVKIPVTTPRRVVTELAGAVLWFASDPEALEHLSEGAVERARHYLWSIQGARMAAVYDNVLRKVGKSVEVRQTRGAAVKGRIEPAIAATASR